MSIAGFIEGMRASYREQRAIRARGSVEGNTHGLLIASTDLQKDVTTFLEKNQTFVNRLHNTYLKHKRRVTLGLVPSENLVIGVWQDRKRGMQVSAFLVQTELACATFAFNDATKYKENDSSFFVFHTTKKYRKLKKEVRVMNRAYAKAVTTPDGTIDMGKAQYSWERFNYNGDNMSPLDYLALVAQKKLSGQETYTTTSLPQRSTAFRRRDR